MAFYHINNIVLNNIDSLLVISFELYLLREFISSRKAKKVFLYGVLLYLLLSIVNILLVQFSGNFNTMTYCFGTFLIVAACIYYFWELFQQKSSVDLVRQPPFWICSGLLFFCTCTFPIFGLTELITRLPAVILQNLYSILIVINICLYLSFTIAFLCRLGTQKSTSM
jgi:drug/metabolite transporter (DMT)-like permease